MQIAEYLSSILEEISKYPVVSVISPTGSGKSVGIPAAISRLQVKCFVTVPTITAAISLSSYQKYVSPHVKVGYAAEGNVQYDDTTQIVYTTSGHMRRKLLSHFIDGKPKPITFCDVLMVDEVHSGTIDNTIILSLWMYIAKYGMQIPRLVLSTATPSPLLIEPQPVIFKIENKGYPIDIRYYNQEIDIDDPRGQIYELTARLIVDVHMNTPITNGDMLVFAPGSGEVETIVRLLSNSNIVNKNAIIIPAYGAMHSDDIEKIYATPPPNSRKIIVATNIAESAITISDLGIIIDTCLEKRAETSLTGGVRLILSRISKDSAQQRAGRTGRTKPGICYRMLTENAFQLLEQYRPSEISRVPLYNAIMELYSVGLTPQNVIHDINTMQINKANKVLTELGMISITPKLSVTGAGYFAPHFPLGVYNSAVLWQWVNEGLPPFPGIVAVSLIDSYGPPYYWLPRKDSTESPNDYTKKIDNHKEKYFSKFRGRSDLHTALNMWNDLMNNIGGFPGDSWDISKWAQNNSINNKKIRELYSIVKQCVKIAERLDIPIKIGPFTTDGVIKAITPILQNVYKNNIFVSRNGITYYSRSTNELYKLENRSSINTLVTDPPMNIIGLITAEIATPSGGIRLISFAVNIPS